MALHIGQDVQASKYTIERELGRGRFGITYLARDRNGNGHVLKTLNDAVLDKPEDFERWQENFVKEAFKLAKCNHPHIVKAREPFQEAGLWCIPMEYVEGVDLKRRAQEQLPIAEALRYIRQIGSALSEVHRHNLVHRDVKPDNIIIRTNRPEAVLIDFGLACQFTPNPTETHTPLISDGYSPLEQYLKRRKQGVYTDVYSLAATLYFLVTVQVPPSALERQDGEPLVMPNRINPKISDRFNHAISQGMALEARDRPQSMAAWLELLERPEIETFPSGQPENQSQTIPPSHQVPPEQQPAPTPASGKPKPASVAFTLLLISSLALSIYNVILKIIFREQTILGLFNLGGLIAPSFANSLLILWFRMLVVVPCMALLATFLYPKVWRDVRKFLLLQDRSLFESVWQSGFWLFLSQILIYIALGQIPAGIAITIFFIYPIVTLLLAWVQFGDRPTPFRVGVMAAIVTGSVFVMLSGGTAGPQNSIIGGSLAAAGSGIAFALYFIQMQASAQQMNVVAVSLIQFAIIFAFASISLLPVEITFELTNRGTLAIGGIILSLVTLVAYLFNNIGIRMAGASLASIIVATGPAMTAILAWIVVGENLLHPLRLMGVLLVTMGVLALSLA